MTHAYLLCWTVNFLGQELCLFMTCLMRYLQPLMKCSAHSGAQQIWYLCVERCNCVPYRAVPLGCDLGSQAPSSIGVKMRWVNTGKATGTNKLLNEQRPLFNCLQEVMAPAAWNAGPAYLWRRAKKHHFSSLPRWHPESGQGWSHLVSQSNTIRGEQSSGWDRLLCPEGGSQDWKISPFPPQPTPAHNEPRVSDKTKKRSRLADEREPRRPTQGRDGSPVRCYTLGRMYPRKWVSLVTMWGTPMGMRSANLWISWMTASVYGIWALSSRAGGRYEPITWSISLWILSAQKNGPSEPHLYFYVGTQFNVLWTLVCSFPGQWAQKTYRRWIGHWHPSE